MEHDVHFGDNGPILSKIDDKERYAWGGGFGQHHLGYFQDGAGQNAKLEVSKPHKPICDITVGCHLAQRRGTVVCL